jgi:HNH endonuclease
MAHALLWNYKVSQWRFGPEDLRPPPHGRTKRTVLMHREIIEHRMGIPAPDATATVDHWDKNSLNNRRSNLRWATKSEQSAGRPSAPPLNTWRCRSDDARRQAI